MKSALLRKLVAKFLFLSRIGHFLTFKFQGSRFGFFPSEMTHEAWKRPATYRGSDWAFLEKVLKPGNLVVDVGSNIGMLSIRAATLVGPSGRVIAIEPNPRIASYSKKNIQLNGLKNVTVMQTALGAEVGTTAFNCDRCDDLSRVVADGGIKIPITTLDKIMEAEPGRQIDLLKIDVEGYELIVLAGARESLRRTQWLYIEVDAQNYAHYGQSVETVTTLLDQHGFDAFICDDSGEWREVKGTISEPVNLIGKKR